METITPQGKKTIQTTKVFTEIETARLQGYTTISEQGSSRSSKTYNTMIWLIVYCLNHPKTTVSVCRASLPSLRRSVLKDFENICQRMGRYKRSNFNKSELLYTFDNNSIIEFFSCDNEQKLRGSKRQILYVNEANELRFMEWQQLKMRTTLLSIIDYNPSFSDEHWLCEVNKDPRTYHFITTYKDNPFLEQVVIDEIESLKTKNKTLWQVYGLGMQAQVEGLVFPTINIINELPNTYYKRRVFIGIDLGYSNDPTAIIKVTIEEETKTLYLDEICYNTAMLTNDIISTLKPYQNIKVISESADPRLIQEVYRAGINIHPVKKFAGSINAGIAKMKEYNINITKQSTNVIKEFKNYVYSQDKEGKYLNQPIDMYNHAIDAIRYVIMSEALGGQRRTIDLNRLAERLGR